MLLSMMLPYGILGLKTLLISLTDFEIIDLINEQKLPKDIEKEVRCNIRQYQFVKSSKKSSHNRKRVKSYERFIEEITHPDVIMSFKKGAKHIFMREYISEIFEEYRVYIYGKRIRYIERYVKFKNGIDPIDPIDVKNNLLKYMQKVLPLIPYHDYVLDIAVTATGFIVIEMNTPLYLFAGVSHSNYYFEKDKIHTAEEPIFRF